MAQRVLRFLPLGRVSPVLNTRLPCLVRSSSSSSSSPDLSVLRARLLYQSKKRGILENDIIIGNFAEENLGEMDESTLKDYDKLINGSHMEWDLFYYVSGKKEAPPEVAASSAFQILKKFVDSRKGLN